MRRFVAMCALSAVVLACSGGDDETAEPAVSTTTSAPATTTTAAPANLDPLTGQPVADPAVLQRAVVGAKVDNTRFGRPQAGIEKADVVYEFQMEGGVTRLMALFHTQDAGPIGPMRSARGSEVGILDQLNRPLFTWHGHNAIEFAQISEANAVLLWIDKIPELFSRSGDRKAPYNSYVQGTQQVRDRAPEKSSAPPPQWKFRSGDEPSSPLARPAKHVRIDWPDPFRGGVNAGIPSTVDWNWDGTRWMRTQGGTPHTTADGTHLGYENVIVRYTGYDDSGAVDNSGSKIIYALTEGEGPAWMLVDGTIVEGRWIKPTRSDVTRYVDADGNDVKLTPGRTWVSVPQPGASSWD